MPFSFLPWLSSVPLIYRFVPRFSLVRVIAFLLVFLSVYDWLTLTNRLFHRACLLLAFGAAVAFARWCGKHETAFLQFFKRATPLLVAGWGLHWPGFRAASGYTSEMR